jgi:hypothetical protein
MNIHQFFIAEISGLLENGKLSNKKSGVRSLNQKK